MENRDIRISCVIVTYNSAATIAKCISSVRDQNIAGLEIIVIDNSSTDNTSEILKRLDIK